MRRERGTDPFIEEVRRRVKPLLTAARINPVTTACTLAWDGPHLTVHFSGATVDPSTRQAIGVRVLDALSSLGHTVGEVDVVFEEGPKSLHV
ncbi:MAG: hypothetical protein JF603_09000 [Acidobacteria bacterium]|nr:hypothetical protein [Acidobacteriota bacterium]